MPDRKGHIRDKATGRYAHEWGVIGTGYGREVAECQHCGLVVAYGGGEAANAPWRKEKSYKDREAARLAGEPMFEGY